MKFNIVYKVAKETAYSNAASALVVAASLNSSVDFSPVVAPNGTVDMGAASAEYNIQRIKRIKGSDVANVNTGTTGAALAALDTFSKVEWETIGVATGALRSVGVKLGINEEFNIDSLGEGHRKAVSDSMELERVERHEAIIEALSKEDGGLTGKAASLAFAAGKTDVFDALTDKADEIMLLSDDFKHMTSEQNMVIILHPSVAKMVSKEIGTVFNQEAPIYTTGFKSSKSINGIPVLVDANLNKYQGTDAAQRLGAIVMDIEALSFKAANESKPVQVDLGLTKFVGKYFYDITKVVDSSRVKTLTFDATAKAAITKKASA